LSTSPFKQFIELQSIALAWLQEAPEVIAKPNHVTITNWVSNSWNHVGVDTIINLWNILRLNPFAE
jgi:hypothetical protein